MCEAATELCCKLRGFGFGFVLLQISDKLFRKSEEHSCQPVDREPLWNRGTRHDGTWRVDVQSHTFL